MTPSPDAENELYHLTDEEIRKRIDDCEKFLRESDWSLELKISSIHYLAVLKGELEYRY